MFEDEQVRDVRSPSDYVQGPLPRWKCSCSALHSLYGAHLRSWVDARVLRSGRLVTYRVQRAGGSMVRFYCSLSIDSRPSMS